MRCTPLFAALAVVVLFGFAPSQVRVVTVGCVAARVP